MDTAKLKEVGQIVGTVLFFTSCIGVFIMTFFAIFACIIVLIASALGAGESVPVSPYDALSRALGLMLLSSVCVAAMLWLRGRES